MGCTKHPRADNKKGGRCGACNRRTKKKDMTRAQKLARAGVIDKHPRRRICPNFTLPEARRVRAITKQKRLLHTLERLPPYGPKAITQSVPTVRDNMKQMVRDARAVLRYLKTGGR